MIKNLFKKICGYCDMCERWFKFPKRQRMHTMYEQEESNFTFCCNECIEHVNDQWDDMWTDYWSSRL